MYDTQKTRDPEILLVFLDGTSTLVGEDWLIQRLAYGYSRDEVLAMRDMARVCLHDCRRVEHEADGEAGILRCIQAAIEVVAARREASLAAFYRRNPEGGKRGHYRYFRRIETMAEIRQNHGWSKIGRLEGEPPPRASRTRGNLPTSWDDICRTRTRSWKAHRRDQWRDSADKR